ncbi:unnamed protein product [Eretmochelys imbricata]
MPLAITTNVTTLGPSKFAVSPPATQEQAPGTAPTMQDPGKRPLEFGGIILISLAVAAVTIMGCTGCVFFFRHGRDLCWS